MISMLDPVGKRRSWSKLLKMSFLVLILWFAFGLRLIYVRRVSPFVDEYISMLAIQAIIERGSPVLPSGLFYGPKALFHSYLGALASWSFGPSEFSVRFPSVLSGLIAVCYVYRVGRKWFSAAVGLSAAMALAWSPSAVEWGGRVRMYSLFQLLCLAGGYLLINGYLSDHGRRTRALGILIMTLAIFAHTLTFIVVLGLAIGVLATWLVYSSNSKPNLLPSFREVIAGIIFLAAVISFDPVTGRAWGPQVRLSDLTQGSIYIWDRIPYLLAFTHQFVTWPLWPLTIFYVIGFISLILRLMRKSPISGDWIALSIYILVACVWLATSLFSKFHENRYMFGILPFYLLLALRELYLLVEVVLTSVKSSFLRSNAFGISSVISILTIALLAPSTVQLINTDTYGFGPAYLYVQDNWHSGDVVATCSPAPSQLVLGQTDYYVIQYGGASLNGVDVWTGAPLVDTPEEFVAILDNNTRVWFVIEKLCWEHHFDANFGEVVHENMQIAFDQKGMLVFVSNPNRMR